MKFAQPIWLWALLAVPLVYFGLIVDEQRRARRFEAFAAMPLWQAIVPGFDRTARLRKARLWLAALALGLVALARPQWGTREETVSVHGLDIMVALDLSNSMEVEDVPPSRLRKAKHLVRSLAERLHGDRIGLIGFASSAYVASPLTNDVEYIAETLDILSPKSISSQGTRIGEALRSARDALNRGAEEAPAAGGPGGSPSRVILLISDGEDHQGGANETAAQLAKEGIKLYVIGVGTEKGGPVPVRDERGNLLAYKKEPRGQPIISSFKPDALTELAVAAGGKYWNATTEESEITEMLQDLNALNRTEYAERRFLVYEERFQYPLAIAVLLLVLEFSIPVTRRSPLVLLAGLALLALNSPDARALEKPVPLDAYLENKKGLEAFTEGKMDEARKHFGSAQAQAPNRPELEFNQGVIQMQEEDVESAIRSFGGAAQNPASNPALGARSYYNLGGALGKKGDTANAIRSYLGAINEARKAGDTQLEADARKNLELLIQKREQQKKEEKEKQDQQKQQQQKQQQQKKDEKQDQQKDEPKDKKDEQKQDRMEDPAESRKRQFNSPKLSHEDAERVMAELKNREKELQTRLKKQNGTKKETEKDW